MTRKAACPCGGRAGFVVVFGVEAVGMHSDEHDASTVKVRTAAGPLIAPRIVWRRVPIRVPCECKAAGSWVAAHQGSGAI